MEKGSIPKFGSYRPKKVSWVGLEARATGSHDQSATSTNIRPRTARDDDIQAELWRGNSHEQAERDFREDPARDRSDKRNGPRKFESPNLHWDDQKRIFFEDRRGDRGNVQYGSINKYEVPSYWFPGEDRLLGNSGSFWNARYPLRSLLSDLNTSQCRELKRYPQYIQPGASTWSPEDDFVTLRPLKRRKYRSSSRGNNILGKDADTEGRNEKKLSISSSSSIDFEDHDVPSDNGKASDDINPGTAEDIVMRQRNQELSKNLKHGGSKAWLEFINFQDIWLRHGNRRTSYKSIQAEEDSIAAVKLSMFEKAIKECPKSDDTNRERLIVGMMETAAKSLDFTKLASRWRELMITEGQKDFNILWSEYLTFTQTVIGAFSNDRCQEVIEECIDFIDRKSSRFDATSRESRVSIERINLVLRATSYLRDAGYLELSVAIWQALLELNFLHPENIWGKGTSKVLKDFEEFWDNESPRIGEKDSKGWMNTPLITSSDQPENGYERIALSRSIGLIKWAVQEQNRVNGATKPGRTTDDATLEDPYRAVLFLDVEKYLFRVSETSRREMIDSFLMFCDLPQVHNVSFDIAIWRSNSLLMPNLPIEFRNSETTSLQVLSNIEYFQSSVENLFCNDDHPFASFCHLSRLPKRDLSFERNIISNLVSALPEYVELAEYYLALEFNLEPNGAKRRAKALVKSMPSSLRLYNVYALIEARSGNRDAADRVFSTAISMSVSLQQVERENVVILWKSWIWEAMFHHEPQTALHRIIQAGKASGTAPSFNSKISLEEVSEARIRLSENIATATISHNQSSSSHYVELLALLAYFTGKSELSDALEIYSSFSALQVQSSNTPTTRNTSLELLHQSQAHLIAYHTQLLAQNEASKPRPYAPSAVRTALTESIRLFPNNTIFLTLYAANEARFRLDDRVRHIMRTATLPGPNEQEQQEEPALISAWAFSVRAEMQRGVTMGSTAHAVRAAFERAVASKPGRICAALWTAFVLFEVERWEAEVAAGRKADESAKRASDVFFRGLRHLPGVKQFYMLAFRRLGGVLGEGELRKVYDVMLEKGLRVHVDYEEWVAT